VQPTELVGRVILAGILLVIFTGWLLSNAAEIDAFHTVASLVAGAAIAVTLVCLTPSNLASIGGTLAVGLAGAYLGPILFARTVVEPNEVGTRTSLQIAGTLAAYLLFWAARSAWRRTRRRGKPGSV
jgi:hypothetical protein